LQKQYVNPQFYYEPKSVVTWCLGVKQSSLDTGCQFTQIKNKIRWQQLKDNPDAMQKQPLQFNRKPDSDQFITGSNLPVIT
jgi:hypothetical protein